MPPERTSETSGAAEWGALKAATAGDLAAAAVLADVEARMFGRPQTAPLGRYVLHGEIGSGGMGTVRAAWDPKLRRRVAIKLLRLRDAREVVRLRREARAMASVIHPNVVQLFELGHASDEPYLVMELVDGATLGRWLAEKQRPWTEVLEILVQCARGLAAVHEEGLVHRDFKPSNVLIDGDRRARVTDFGLTRAGRSSPGPLVPNFTHADMVTRHGAVAGTPAYMAPERQRGEVADARSDQWELCLVAWEALFAARPPGMDRTRTFSWSAAAGAVPGQIRRALQRGLAVEPAARWPTITALANQLERHRRPRASRYWLAIACAAGLGLGIDSDDDVAASWLGEQSAIPTPSYQGQDLAEGSERALWGRPMEAAAPLEQAYFEADALGDAQAAAEAALALMQLFASDLASTDVARRWNRAVLVQIERGALDPLVELRRSDTYAKLLYAEAEFAESRRRSLEVVTQVENLPASDAAADIRESALTNAGLAAFALGKEEEARQLLGAAYASMWDRHGPTSRRALGGRYNLLLLRVDGARGDPTLLDDLDALRIDVERRLGSVVLLAHVHEGKASAHESRSETEAAIVSRQAALEVYVEVLGEEHPQVALALTNLGVQLSNAGRAREAMARLDQALLLQERLLGPEHLDVAKTLISRGVALSDSSRNHEAMESFRRAEPIMLRALGESALPVKELRLRQGLLARRLGDFENAEGALRRALDDFPPGSTLHVAADLGLVEVALDQGDDGPRTRARFAATAAHVADLDPSMRTWRENVATRLE